MSTSAAPTLSAVQVWTGGAGVGNSFWDLALNWTELPTSGDAVLLGEADTTIRSGSWMLSSAQGTGALTIGTGSLSVLLASALGPLILQGGGVLGGPSSISVASLSWSTNGGFGDAGAPGGTTTINGATTLVGNGGNGHGVNFGQTLNLNGDVSWVSNSNFTVAGAGVAQNVPYGPSTVNLAAGRTMTVQPGVSDSVSLAGAGAFNNFGTLVQARPSTILYVNTNFVNAGLLAVQAGEVQFLGTRTVGGVVSVASGAALTFNGATTLDAQLSLTNAGSLLFTGTSTLVPSGLLTIAGSGVNTLATNSSLGGAGSVVLNNLVWNTNGGMGLTSSTGGSITINGATTLVGNGGNGHGVGFGQTLNLNGDVSWVSNSNFMIAGTDVAQNVPYGPSTVNLAAGRTMTVQPGVSDSVSLAGAGTFNNFGTLVQARPSTILYVDTNFVNAGVLAVQAGQVQFLGTRTVGGVVNVANGAALTLNGVITLDAQLALTNAGSLLFTGTSVRVPGGTVAIGGNGANTLAQNASVGGAGHLILNNLTWNTNAGFGLAGMPGGATTIQGLTSLVDNGGNGQFVDIGHTVTFNGDVSWIGSTALSIAGVGVTPPHGASTVTLAAGATLTVQPGSGSGVAIVGAGTFHNAGTVVQARPNTSLVINTNFVNEGTLLTKPSTSVTLPANFTNPGTLAGRGTFVASGLENNGHVAPGESPGTLTIAGSISQGAQGFLDIELESLVSHDLLNVTGSAVLGGTLHLMCYGGCAFAAGQTVTILDAAPNALTGAFANVILSGFDNLSFVVVYDRANGDVLLNAVPVPEQSRTAMMLAGVGLLGWLRLRRTVFT